MANGSYWIGNTSYTKSIHSIADEVHLVKLGEFRRLDYNIIPYSNFTANVAINMDYGRNGFIVMEPNEELMDACGFMRVVISYTTEGY